MALGIDIYARYQKVSDWHAVKGRGVGYIWVKLTDGNGRVANPGDALVAGAKSVGIPVGGYHFSQPGSPEGQADVLLGEVRRLGATGLVPMLDMEDNPPGSGQPNIPAGQKRDFVIRFCNHIQAAGFRPGVYMNNADARALRPDTMPVPGLVIWIARYGAKPDYGGRYDLHQYSSSGTVSGIQAQAVDLNESYTNNHFAHGAITPEDDDMSITAPAGTNEHVDLVVKGKSSLYIACSYGQKVEVLQADFFGDTGDDPNGTGVGGAFALTFDPNRPGPIPIPPDAAMLTIRYNADHSFGVGAV